MNISLHTPAKLSSVTPASSTGPSSEVIDTADAVAVHDCAGCVTDMKRTSSEVMDTSKVSLVSSASSASLSSLSSGVLKTADADEVQGSVSDTEPATSEATGTSVIVTCALYRQTRTMHNCRNTGEYTKATFIISI